MTTRDLIDFNKKQMVEMFNDFRFNNKISDENKLRKSMIYSIMKVYTDRLVNVEHKEVGKSINAAIDMVNDFAAENPDYLPSSMYKAIIGKLREYGATLNNDVPKLINTEFLSNLDVSKVNALSSSENPSNQLKEAVCEGYRKEIMEEFYKANNDIWFKK